MTKIALVVLFAALLRVGAAIRCYDCNSANNSMCLNPKIYDAESVQKYLRTVTCERGLPAAGQHANKEMFCRKIVQTILHKGHDAEVRVTRGCGWVKHHRDCYKADNEDHLETVCQCFSDDCNGSSTLGHGLATALTALSTLVLII